VGSGVHLDDNNANVLIFNGTSTADTAWNGITLRNGNTNVAIMDVDIERTGNGIEIQDNNTAITISGVTINGLVFDGIQIQGARAAIRSIFRMCE